MIENTRHTGRSLRKVFSLFRRPSPPQQQAETQRADEQVMEAVARLAGGVAHDLNNILLVVQGYVDMALQEEDAGPETRHHLEEVRGAAARAVRLVGDLLVIGQRGPFSPRLLDLNDLLTRLAPAWGAETGASVQVRLSLAENLPPVFADEVHLARLCSLFCARAREVMPSGGVLTFCTRAGESGPPEAQRVLLEVSDDGAGEPMEIRSRLFEPYLPGRAGGKALGLGLSLARGIVKRMGGDIAAEYSDAGAARFLVSIPARQQPLVDAASSAPSSEVTPAQREPSRGTGQSILLAEDDEGLRTLAARVLAREGYVVLVARDGQEAVELFERNSTSVRLALLDDVMPRMGGRAALLRMRSLIPGLPAILCTGYTWSFDGKAAETGEGFQVLAKPWRPRDLLLLVREELEPGRQ